MLKHPNLDLVKGLMPVTPLATPKGQEIPRCKVCKSMARLCCADCRANYCGEEHYRVDRLHSMLCSYLKDLRELERYVDTSEERERKKKLRDIKYMTLARRTQDMALQALTDGEPEQALLAAQFSLQTHQQILGRDHEDTILVSLLVSSCYMDVNKLQKAVNFLGQVDHYLASRDNTSPLVLGEYAKTSGQLAMLQGRFKDAIYHFSDDVYHMSQHFSSDHHRTAVSLWRLGQAFLALDKPSVTNSMYRQAVGVWQRFLLDLLMLVEAGEEEAGRAVVSIGIERTPGLLDQRAKTDGSVMIKDILQTRRTIKELSDPIDVLIISYVQAMYMFVNKSFIQSFRIMTEIVDDLLPVTPQVEPAFREQIVSMYKRARRRTPAPGQVRSLPPETSNVFGQSTTKSTL